MNRMTDGITNYGALPGSIYDQPPEESEAVFVPPEFAGSFSADSKYPTSRDSSSPNSGAHDSAATPTMSESLAQRRRDMVARCTEEAKRAGKKLLFGMTTSLALQSVPIPADCDLDSAKLHTVSSVKSKRFRTRHAPLQTHIWKHAAKAANVEMNQHVFALDLFHVWAQLAPYVSFESLIVLGDAVITATSKQPVLAKDRDAAAIYLEKGDFKKNLARIIAIVEQYPFAALYAPTCVAVLRVFRNAVDRGFAKEGLRKIDWNSHVNGYMNKTQVNMPYIQLLRMYAGAQLGEKNRKALEGNQRSIGCGYLDDDLTEDMLAEELAEAREEVAETMQRETPPERERYTSASYNADDIFGSEEDDVSHSSDTADRVQGTGKRNSGNAGYKEEERAGSVGIDDDDDDDDFPF